MKSEVDGQVRRSFEATLIMYISSYLLSDHCTASKIEEIGQSRVPVEFYNRVLSVLELMMIKKNILHALFVFLDRNVINVCISAVCSDRF